IVCLLVCEVSSERSTTASLRTAPQLGFWEDPKRMRPIGTQRPERPKSELRTKNTKNAAFARLPEAHWRRGRPRGMRELEGNSSRFAPPRTHEQFIGQSIRAALSLNRAEIRRPLYVL